MELFVLKTDFSERLFLGKLLRIFKKPSRVSTREWAETNRFLTSDVTSRPGRMDCMQTPWMLGVMKVLDNPEIPVVVGKKSAQIAWTETINNWIGRTIDLDPRNMMIAFPRAASAQKFYKEKLVPYITHTPALRDKIGSLAKVSHKHIPFPGGFLILANAGTAEDGKSSVIPYIIVEEPDGVKKDVNNQGDGMAILKQRMKSFSDGKLVYAGTPTDKDFSQVDLAYEQSDKRVYMVPCHHCQEFAPLSFSNLKYDPFQDRKIDEFYGNYNPETAYYECPNCLGIWTNEEKNANVARAINFFDDGWMATNPSVTDTVGFAFNELLSSFTASSLVNLAKQKLKAEVAYEKGHEGLMKSFTNNSMGEAYVPLNSGLELEELISMRLNYPEEVVPMEGLILTAGVDVQRNRFAIIIRAWGRNGNSWLVSWKEIFGDVLDYSDPVWERLWSEITYKFPHAAGNGKTLQIAAVSIDSGDGTTAELVYRFVQEKSSLHNHIFAIKGIGEMKSNTYEIYNEPGSLDLTTPGQERKTLAQTMGVNVFPMGTYRAHEEIMRRLNISGTRDRYYHCETAYGDYEEQILSCRKTYSGELEKVSYKLISGKRKEALDCEKMALHASYAIHVRSYTDAHWSAIENYLY